MPLIKRCHEMVKFHSSHVLTSVRLEDEEGATDKLREGIASVERAAGRRLKHCQVITLTIKGAHHG